MSLNLSGVFSGIDTDLIISYAMAANRRPLNRLESRKADWEAKADALDDIKDRFSDLKSNLDTLRDASDFHLVFATTSDRDVLGARVTEGGVGEGSYVIEVNQLAKAEREVHDGVASLTTTLGAGTLVYTYDGEQRTVQTSADSTVEDLRDLINNDGGNPGVQASILEYDDGLGGVYHLVLSGKDTGADYVITIDAATTLTDFAPADWSETQTAQDAQVRVDGYPAADWIEKSGNTITDLISGVTIDLATTGTATITMSRDTSELVQDLGNLVNIYNGMVDRIKEYTSRDEETGETGVMQGDATLHGMLAQVRAILTGTADGFQSGQDTFMMPVQIGIEPMPMELGAGVDLGKVDQLSLNEETLADAIDEDFDGVLALIGALATGGTDSTDLQFNYAAETTQAAIYDVEVDFDGAGDITAARIKLEDASGFTSMTVNGDTLTGWSGKPEAGMSLTVINGGTSETKTYQVRVQKGFTGAAYDVVEELLNVVDGAFVTKEEQYDLAVDAIDSQILWQEDRLATMEQRLVEKYARLEMALAELDSQRGAFDALFASLESTNSES